MFIALSTSVFFYLGTNKSYKSLIIHLAFRYKQISIDLLKQNHFFKVLLKFNTSFNF